VHWANDVERRSLSQGHSYEEMWRCRWWSLSPVHTAYGAVRRCRTLQMLKLYATYHCLLRQRRNATTDGNATYDDAVCVIAAVEIDYNVAVLV